MQTSTLLFLARPADESRPAGYRFCCCFLFYVLIRFLSVPSVLLRCWLGGRKGIRRVKKLSGGVLAWLSVWSEVQTCIWSSCCHCHSLTLASVHSRLILPFWYRLTRKKGPLNGCMCVLSDQLSTVPIFAKFAGLVGLRP